jgi:hypothetical protein
MPIPNTEHVESFLSNYKIANIYFIYNLEKYKELYTKKKDLHSSKNKLSAKLRAEDFNDEYR